MTVPQNILIQLTVNHRYKQSNMYDWAVYTFICLLRLVVQILLNLLLCPSNTFLNEIFQGIGRERRSMLVREVFKGLNYRSIFNIITEQHLSTTEYLTLYRTIQIIKAKIFENELKA